MSKTIIYQVIPRLFGNNRSVNEEGGSIETNGCGKLNAFSSEVLNHFKQMGISHMWYTGVLEHATATDYSEFHIIKDNPQVVKGLAGSPYAVKDYYDIDPDLASHPEQRMAEFEDLIHRTHQAGLKVLIDFVPNHLARHYHSDAKPDGVVDFGENDDSSQAFIPSNNYYYLSNTEFRAPKPATTNNWEEVPARATGNDCFKPDPNVTDWYETVKLNYGVDIQNGHQTHFSPLPDTWIKMKDILLFWASKGVDGFRCDMAEMVPVEFWQWCLIEVKKQYPKLLFVAEVYQPDLYLKYIQEGGFDLLYDKVGFYDALVDVIKNRKMMTDLSEAWHRIDTISSKMLFFLENHDEVRLASDMLCGNGLKAWPAWVIMASYASNPIMIYAGQELGERGMDVEGFSGRDGRTSIFDYWSVNSLRRYYAHIINKGDGLLEGELLLLERYVKLNAIIHQYKALTKGGVYDLMWCNNKNGGLNSRRVYALLRYQQDEWILVLSNFSAAEQSLRIIIPEQAFDIMGIKTKTYFHGKELLDNARAIAFPKEIAITRGLGVKIGAYQALMFHFNN